MKAVPRASAQQRLADETACRRGLANALIWRGFRFATRALLFVSALRVLWLVNQDAARTENPWWLLPACVVAVLSGLLHVRWPKPARLLGLSAACIALATVAHGRFAWVAWLLLGVLLELTIRSLRTDASGA